MRKFRERYLIKINGMNIQSRSRILKLVYAQRTHSRITRIWIEWNVFTILAHMNIIYNILYVYLYRYYSTHIFPIVPFENGEWLNYLSTCYMYDTQDAHMNFRMAAWLMMKTNDSQTISHILMQYDKRISYCHRLVCLLQSTEVYGV